MRGYGLIVPDCAQKASNSPEWSLKVPTSLGRLPLPRLDTPTCNLRMVRLRGFEEESNCRGLKISPNDGPKFLVQLCLKYASKRYG